MTANYQKNSNNAIFTKTDCENDTGFNSRVEVGSCIDTGILFDEDTIRRKFLRKVYLILMAQLVVTLALLSFFVYNTTFKTFINNNPATFWLAFAVLLISMLVMACCDNIRRETPMNFVFLGMFTIAESFMLGTIVAQLAHEEILFAVAITSILCFALSLYALQTSVDYTMMGGVLLISLLLLMLFGLVSLFFPGKGMVMIYSSMGALLFSVYVIYDTQLMMGGQHKYTLSPEEYVFAALNLYLDIVNIFLYILSIINSTRS